MDQFTADECARITCNDFKEKFLRIQTLQTEAGASTAEKEFTLLLLRQMPRSVLEELPDNEFVQWGRRLHRIVLNRKEAYTVLLEPVEGEQSWHLVSQTTDAYFLFDALQNLLLRQHLHFRIICHPLLHVNRKASSVTISGPNGHDNLESLIWIELEGLGRQQVAPLIAETGEVIQAVLTMNAGTVAMQQRLDALGSQPDLEHCWPLVHWLGQHNFVITSYRQVLQPGLDAHHEPVSLATETSLGLPTELDLLLDGGPLLHHLPDDLQHRLLRNNTVVLEELSERSPFHRGDHLTCIGFRQNNKKGWKDHLFYGFFTQKAQDDVAWTIFALRGRVEKILGELRIPRDSHDYSKAIEIINAFPKVELFLLSDQQLTEIVRTFPLFYRHEGVRLVAMPRLSPSRLTLLMILPKDHFSPERIARIENYLGRHFKAEAVGSRIIHVSKSYMSLHVHIQTFSGLGQIDLGKLEGALTRLALPWPTVFRRQLEAVDQELALERYQRFCHVFDADYRSRIHPRYAVRDLRNIEEVLLNKTDAFDLWGPFQEGEESYYQLQYYSLHRTYLNDLMPFLENLLLSVIQQVDFDLKVDGHPVYIKSFSIRFADPARMDMAQLRERLRDSLRALNSGDVENDTLHQLQPLTGLSWKQIDVFRAYRNYYFQLGNPFTKGRVALALINNPEVSQLLYRYFEGRFLPDPSLNDPMEREEKQLMPVRMELSETLQQVADINEDRILRTLFNLIDSTVRTNFFLRIDQPDYFVSLKISSMGVIEMPAPRPLFEVYVHSASMEGIHLRGGKVARGGIRWSDRPDDFRTEVLGLMKAQMTKNAVIVPVGSKGGFVVKTPFVDREEGGRLSKEAYKTLMRGLLDLTDNRVAGKIVRSEGIIAYDEEDPYLVVAADKGTAHLPDTANGVAAEYDFWLGDAFASGGSYGYDHKKLGITAKGAWESVKRHFREMDKDIQSEPFSAVGIGDMSGDVFGNGLLLSKFTCLKGAFNHRHIFIDPDPDPELSWHERQRLFNLPRSGWSDYNTQLISKGGGVFERSAKDIPVSAEMRDWLGLRHATIDGQELIRALLKSEVDLLWNGGIGTYVKSTEESQEDAGDRNNDAVRIDAPQLKALVVGEGGNLGLTQRGRVEYAQAGGRIYTDALDNSAGVDCSDHEVNIKIFLQQLLQQGELSDLDAVHTHVEKVTDVVAEMVLQNNYTQSLCLSLDHRRCQQDAEPYLELMDRLSASGLLDQESEFLPRAKTVRSRVDGSFSRPELFVLMAYSKMYLYRSLLDSDLPDRPEAKELLLSYFPPEMVDEFKEKLLDHPLKREIAATVMTNQIVDQAGSPAWHQLSNRGGVRTVQAAETYLFFDQAYGGTTMRKAIWELDNRIAADLQGRLLLQLETVLTNAALYSLEQGLDICLDEERLGLYRHRIQEYQSILASTMPEAEWQALLEKAEPLVEAGMEEQIAQQLVTLSAHNGLLPLFQLVDQTGEDLYSISRTFSEVSKGLQLDRVLERLRAVPQQDRWDRQAGMALYASIESTGYLLTQSVLLETQGNPDAYWSKQRGKWRVYRTLREQVLTSNPRNFHPFNVLSRAMEGLLTHRQS